jgi:hypothetical protein
MEDRQAPATARTPFTDLGQGTLVAVTMIVIAVGRIQVLAGKLRGYPRSPTAGQSQQLPMQRSRALNRLNLSRGAGGVRRRKEALPRNQIGVRTGSVRPSSRDAGATR